MDPEEMREKFVGWLADGETWIGVFENQLPGTGDRVAIAFDMSEYDDAEFGTRAPDMPSFIGWRHTLVAKCRTVDEALKAMSREGRD